MATESEVVNRLRANIGNAKHFELHSGGDAIAAGIHSIDEVNKRVKYLHGRGLRALKDAQESQQPEQPILDTEANYAYKDFSEIKDVI